MLKTIFFLDGHFCMYVNIGDNTTLDFKYFELIDKFNFDGIE